jgi:predicted membrane protein
MGFVRRVLQRIFFGVVLLAVAVIIFANGVFGLGLKLTFFAGWWTLFLIIPGISGIIAEGPRFWNMILTVVGVSLLAQAQGWLPENISGSVFWSGLIIIFALWLIIGAFRPRGSYVRQRIKYHSSSSSNQDSNDYPEYIAVFSSHDTKNTSKSFRGGKITAVFGSSVIDLSEIELVSDVNLEVSAVFGSVELILPADLPIKITATPIFGGIDNSIANPSKVEGKFTLYIKGAAVFGGIQIMN